MSDTRIVKDQADSWARELTLSRLLDETRDQTGLLEKIAGVKASDTRATRKLEESADDAADALSETADSARKAKIEADRAAAKARERERKEEEDHYLRQRREDQYRRSLNDLKNNLNSVSTATPATLWSGLGDRMAVFGGNLRATNGRFSALGGSVTRLSQVMAGASFVFGALTAMVDPYRQLVETGNLFEGSAVRFSIAALESGLGLQQFTRIATQYSETVSAVGGQAYADSIRIFRESSRQAGYYGMSMDELAEAQTRHMSYLRESGLLFYMTAQQQRDATSDYLKELTAVSVLQGRQRRQLEEEQRRAQRRAQIQLVLEQVRRTEGEEAARAIEQRYGTMVTRVGQTAADVAFAQQFGLGGPTQEEARKLGVSGLLEPAMAGVDFRNQSSVEHYIGRFQEAALNIPLERLGTLALAARRDTMAAAAARELAEGEDSIFRRARAERAGPDALGRRAQAEAARRGEIIDQTTTDVITAQNRGRESINYLASAAIRSADSLGLLSTVARAAATAGDIAAGGASALANMAGPALGLAGLGLGGVALLRARSAATAGLAALPSMGALGGAPTVPGIPGTAGRSLLGMTGGKALGGAGLGLAGAGLGALATGAGYGTLGGALSGAGMGAGLGMIAGPWGAALGGVLGGLAGAFGLLGGGEAAPAGAAPAPDMTSSMSRINTTLIEQLGETGAIVRRLDMLISAVNNSNRPVVRAIQQN
jgi:hypothetical protein